MSFGSVLIISRLDNQSKFQMTHIYKTNSGQRNFCPVQFSVIKIFTYIKKNKKTKKKLGQISALPIQFSVIKLAIST